MYERGIFIQHLILEHVDILKVLDRLKDIVCSSEKKLLLLKDEGFEVLALLRTTLELHHLKEEKILFPALHRRAPLNEGGPRCSQYMTHLLVENAGRTFLEKATQLGIKIEPPRSELKGIIEANSPLKIPLHEHWGGHVALRILERYLLELNSNPSEIQKEFFIEGMRFDRMMRLHIEKEETCLFVIADMFLTDAVQTELVRQFAD